MLWKTVGDLLEEDFLEWCKKVDAEPDERMMIEFLGAAGLLKIKKAAKTFVNNNRLPKYNDRIVSRIFTLREGMIPPASVAYYEE